MPGKKAGSVKAKEMSRTSGKPSAELKLRDWDKFIEPLVEDVRQSAQLSSEDYAIRINARS